MSKMAFYAEVLMATAVITVVCIMIYKIVISKDA
jgi:hypothetical protein